MGHYITNSLEEGEQIVFQGHLHWTAIAKYMISSISLLTVAGGFISSIDVAYQAYNDYWTGPSWYIGN